MSSAMPRMSWHRVVNASVMLAMVGAVALLAPTLWHYQQSMSEQVRATQRALPANDANQAAIVRAIVTMERSPVRPPPPPPPPPPLPGRERVRTPVAIMSPADRLPVGLLGWTLSLRSCDPPRPSGAIRCDMGGHMGEQIEEASRPSSFPLAWRRGLVAASLAPVPLADPRVDGIVLIAGNSDAVSRTAGFSRAVLSPDGRAALIYFEARGRTLGAACIIFKMALTSRGWEVVESEWYCVG
jgi:hypothetical protein